MAGTDRRDRDEFGPGWLPALRQAAADLSWLLGRDYADRAALKLVGDRFQLSRRQRLALLRGACGPERADCRRREERRTSAGPVAVDALNVLITAETALTGGLLIRGLDGRLRDLAGIHGGFRLSATTEAALSRLAGPLRRAPACRWYIDRPVSRSGQLAEMLRRHGFDAEVVNDADAAIVASGWHAATSDGPLMDRVGATVDLVGPVVDDLPAAWVVDLGEPHKQPLDRWARVIAVDWSGARSGASRAICLAEVRDGRLVRVERGRDREKMTEHLIALLDDHDSELFVGLDFSFSAPAWFLRERNLTAETLWETDTDPWLRACEPPFWGRPGRGRPQLPAHLRRAEAALEARHGVRPKSLFQIGGAGAVGTASLRGFATLARLRAAGYAIWPFDPPGRATVVEIYPRLFTGGVNKSSRAAREARLARYQLPAPLRAAALEDDHAFDATVSALEMARHADLLRHLEPARDETERLEGRIFDPGAG